MRVVLAGGQTSGPRAARMARRATNVAPDYDYRLVLGGPLLCPGRSCAAARPPTVPAAATPPTIATIEPVERPWLLTPAAAPPPAPAPAPPAALAVLVSRLMPVTSINCEAPATL